MRRLHAVTLFAGIIRNGCGSSLTQWPATGRTIGAGEAAHWKREKQGMAERTGLEPATPGVTGRYSDQLNYRSGICRSALRRIIASAGVARTNPVRDFRRNDEFQE